MEVVESILGFGGHGRLNPRYVVIHETAGPGAPAVNLVSWWRNGGGLPVHYVGDWTGKCYHCVPEDEICWQVGNGNPYVVGIELCHATNAEDFERVWRLGVEWAAWQLSKRGWGVENLISHYDCTRIWGGSDHTDPIGYFAEFGRTWEQFVEDVDAYMKHGGWERKVDDLKPIFNLGGPCQRLYDRKTGRHMFTLDESERKALEASGWTYEGVAFETRRGGSDPVFRMYDPTSGDHLFTVDFTEASSLQSSGWQFEGVPFFAWGEPGTLVHRMYSPHDGHHFMTANDAEMKSLVAEGWTVERTFAV